MSETIYVVKTHDEYHAVRGGRVLTSLVSAGVSAEAFERVVSDLLDGDWPTVVGLMAGLDPHWAERFVDCHDESSNDLLQSLLDAQPGLLPALAYVDRQRQVREHAARVDAAGGSAEEPELPF